MGFYDCRCMVTGVSLTGSTTLVVLRQAGGGYQPITLGITGTYDRYGCIDGVREDANTHLVLTYFLDKLRDGALVVNEPGYPPIADIEDLLFCFERNGLCFEEDPLVREGPWATLNGATIVFALIAQPVWDALSAAVTLSQGSVAVWFERLFGDCSIAGEIYQGRLAEVSEQVRQLCVLNEFMASRGLVWTASPTPSQRYPTVMGCQHTADEIRAFLDEAKRDFGDVAALHAAFDEYEAKVKDLLSVDEDDDDEDDGPASESARPTALYAVGLFGEPPCGDELGQP